MTHLDPNPPTGQRPGPGAGRPQTMWLIAAAIIVLLVLGYFASGDRTSVTPQTPGATAPADTDATAPAPIRDSARVLEPELLGDRPRRSELRRVVRRKRVGEPRVTHGGRSFHGERSGRSTPSGQP